MSVGHALLGLAILPLAVLCATAPLAVYTVSLALFGLAHVTYELRYVDGRFARQLPSWAVRSAVALLVVIVGLRIAGLAGALSRDESMLAELVAVTGLAAVSIPLVLPLGWLAAVAGALLTLCVGAGAVLAPLWTFALLAVAHNWTPLGFFAEAASPPRRLGLALFAAVGFVLVPLALVFGWVPVLGQGSWLDASPLVDGGVAAQFGAYLHPSLHAHDAAVRLFSAAVFAQCMHYVAVIGVLPRLDDGLPRLSWPQPRWLALGVVAVSALLLLGYARDFGDARSVYGVAAAVHAWIELPLLVFALGLVLRRRSVG